MSGPDGRLPTFLIVGAMKAGTTSLFRWLGDHPDVWVFPDKEVHFFERPELWARGPEWYRRQFAGAGRQRAVGEATPSYMFVPDGPARMARVVPDARLVAVLRHPVERAWSHYWHQRFLGLEDLPFMEAVALEGRRESLRKGWDPHYLDRGRYLPQLLRVLEHFPADALHVVLLDDMEVDPVGTYAAVCRFLRIDDGVVPTSVGSRVNPYREHRSLRLWTLTWKVDLWNRLPRRLVPRVARLLWREGRPPPLDPAVRADLLERLADDNEALARWLRRSLPDAWSC